MQGMAIFASNKKLSGLCSHSSCSTCTYAEIGFAHRGFLCESEINSLYLRWLLISIVSNTSSVGAQQYVRVVLIVSIMLRPVPYDPLEFNHCISDTNHCIIPLITYYHAVAVAVNRHVSPSILLPSVAVPGRSTDFSCHGFSLSTCRAHTVVNNTSC